MSERTTGTRDEHYNVISVLYHALQGADTCGTYLQDAESRARTGSWATGVRRSCGNDSARRMPVGGNAPDGRRFACLQPRHHMH
jgi:hypothetical protein